MSTLEIFLSAAIVLLLIYIIVDGRHQRRLIRKYQESIDHHAELIKSLEKLRTDVLDSYRKIFDKI